MGILGFWSIANVLIYAVMSGITVLVIWALILAIKALHIYIRKNS